MVGESGSCMVAFAAACNSRHRAHFQVRRLGDFPKHAAPFDDDSVDVARTEQISHPRMFA